MDFIFFIYFQNQRAAIEEARRVAIDLMRYFEDECVAIPNEANETTTLSGSSLVKAIKRWFCGISDKTVATAANNNNEMTDLSGSDLKVFSGAVSHCEKVHVSYEGVCSGCGKQLQSLDLSDTQFDQLADMCRGLARQTFRHAKQLEHFESFLKNASDEGHDFDVFVDAANVGYFGQNFIDGDFNFEQIDNMLRLLILADLKPLLILHERHFLTHSIRDSSIQREIVLRWIQERLVYRVPHSTNDDWFWMIAALARKSHGFFVSNDQMKDHCFAAFPTKPFQLWKDRHQIFFNFSFPLRQAMPHLILPQCISQRPQRVDIVDESLVQWHFPLDANYTTVRHHRNTKLVDQPDRTLSKCGRDVDKCPTKWLCCDAMKRND